MFGTSTKLCLFGGNFNCLVVQLLCKPDTVTYAAHAAVRLHWELRKADERGHVSPAEMQQMVQAAAKGEAARAIAQRMDRDDHTVAKWTKQWGATQSFESPSRGNSGRKRTATDPATVAAVVSAVTAVPIDQHRPSAPTLKRMLKLRCSVQSVRNALRRGGLVSRSKREAPLLGSEDKVRRLRWARRIAASVDQLASDCV